MTSSIPKPSEPIAGPGGIITRPWRNYLSQLGGARSLEDIWAALREIRQQLADAGAGSFLTRDTALLGVNSVQTLGQLSDGRVRIQLRGDTPAPAARTFYGANADGVLGFWSNAEGVDVGPGLAKALDYGPYDFRGELSKESDLPPVVVVGDAYLIAGYLWAGVDEGRPEDPAWDNLGLASPTTVLSLEEVPDSGEGALLAITRDQFGRVSGIREAFLGDLSDVVLAAPANGDSLVFDSSLTKWVPSPGGGAPVQSVNDQVGAVVLTEGNLTGLVTRLSGALHTAEAVHEVIEMDWPAENELVLPPNTTAPFPVGRSLEVWQAGAGQTTIAAGAGVSIIPPLGMSTRLRGIGCGCSLRQVAIDTWRLVGDLEPA